MRDTYDKIIKDFSIDIPEYYNFAQDVIDVSAKKDERKLAMVWAPEHCQGPHDERVQYLTFAWFSDMSHKSARLFNDHQLQKGDRVLVMLPRIPHWWTAVVGLVRLGVVVIPCTTLLTPRDLEFRANLAEAKAIITDKTGAQKFETIRDKATTITCTIVVDSGDGIDFHNHEQWIKYDMIESWDKTTMEVAKTHRKDPCLIYFTSGTSGYPKMVTHTHISYPLGLKVTGKYWLDLKPSDLHWNLSEMGWAKAAWSNLFAPWLCEAAIFIQDIRSSKFDPEGVLRTLHQFPITTLCAPPTAYRMLVLEKPLEYFGAHPFKALRSCTGAGEPLNPEVIRRWHKHTKMHIRDGYGQTETTLLCGNLPGMELRIGSMGKPMPGCCVAIIDEDGKEVPAGKEGDIAVYVKPERPPFIFGGYFKRPDLTEKAIRKGEWYCTGDRAYRDDDGYIYFVGRADDVILSSGYRIGPFEVESALKEHPAVVESAVVASPDDIRGEVVKAFIVLTEAARSKPQDALIKDIQEHVRKVTSPYKYPREVEFLDALPKTISGKIRRVELREQENKKKWAMGVRAKRPSRL